MILWKHPLHVGVFLWGAGVLGREVTFTGAKMDASKPSMRIGDPLDPALEAASLTLSGRANQSSSRFASIELRGTEVRRLSGLAPLGYAVSVIAALTVVGALWAL